MNYPKDLEAVCTKFFSMECLDDELEEFKNTKNDEHWDLIAYHMGFGTFLRNHYQMWKEENIVEDDEFGFPMEPDELSFMYIKEFHRLLNKDIEDDN